MDTITVGLYGANGHQIQDKLSRYPYAQLKGIAAFDKKKLPEELRDDVSINNYKSLDELINDDNIQLISLCSPRRDRQAEDAIKCLKAGKHVYAEKPCAMTEKQLDRIISTVQETGLMFHEMADTAFEQPYLEMRKLVTANRIGQVVQVYAQKSYPYHDGRPQDEGVDGGLLMQVGIHAVRMIEHVAQVRVCSVRSEETQLSNPGTGDLRTACTMMMSLENGGLAVAIANYLNPECFGRWGNESLRIFGTEGFIETVDGGTITRQFLNKDRCGTINISEPSKDYFGLYIDSLLGKSKMPLTLEEELHPTRIVIQAKQNVL